MRRLTLLTLGKIRTPGLRETQDHFALMLKRYASFEEVELRPSPVLGDRAANKEQASLADTDQVLKWLTEHKVDPGSRILLDPTGVAMDALAWHAYFSDRAPPQITFVIGGACGLSRPHAIWNSRTRVVSLGKGTFSHDLARVVLTEQLFRAHASVAGHPYQK